MAIIRSCYWCHIWRSKLLSAQTVPHPKLQVPLVSSRIFHYISKPNFQLTQVETTYIYSFSLSRCCLFVVAQHSSRSFCWRELDAVISGPLYHYQRLIHTSHYPLSHHITFAVLTAECLFTLPAIHELLLRHSRSLHLWIITQRELHFQRSFMLEASLKLKIVSQVLLCSVFFTNTTCFLLFK